MSTSDQTRAYYDEQADVYDEKTGFGARTGQEYNFKRYYLPLLREAIPSSGTVLELGCGTGFYTKWLEERGLKVYAMDISSKMVNLARRRCPDDVTLSVGNCEDPASALGVDAVANRFDAIIGINTFSYYPNKLAALRNYRQLLRPGGRLIVLDMNGSSLTQQLAYLFNYRGARRFARNINQSTPKRLTAMLERSGFAVERMKRFTFMPNGASRGWVTLLTPVDRVLSRLPGVDVFAFRIFWVARPE